MIDYEKISNAIKYYKNAGFYPIEVPWTVSPEVDDITRPKDRIHMQLKHNDKCLIGSGEQGFLYLYCKDYILPGKYQTTTPCWRYEHYDGMHAKCFMKTELIITDDVTIDELNKLIDIAKNFYSKYLDVEVEKVEVADSIINYDIVSKIGHYELGSYGIRTCDYLKWIYGTGCAEPRLSRVLKSIELKNNIIS